MTKEYEFQTITLDKIDDLAGITINLSPSGMDSSISAEDTITITNGLGLNGTSASDIWAINNNSYNYSAVPNVTISSGYTNTTSTVYTLGAGGNPSWSNVAAGTSVNQTGRLTLNGEGADVDINGKSLKSWMEKVEERLNILTPNPELEKEWDDLRKLGERYRKLEKKCKEKAEVWKKLKAMPPPKLD